MIAVCVAGLVAGALHVFAGPDHLAALAPLSIQARRRAWALGLRWGVGHSAGVAVVATLAYGLRQAVDLRAYAGWGERLIGATLILLGIWGFRSLFRKRLHAHMHGPEGEEHVHFHAHAPGEDHDAPKAHVHAHAAFGIGLLHGLAGTAHLVGILPSLALPSWPQTAGYLGSFALGTVIAMVSFATAMGRFAPRRSERGHRWALTCASALCVGVGTAWIILPMLGLALP